MKILEKFTATDFIAGAILIMITLLKINGYNGHLDSTLALIVGYYFGKKYIKVQESHE